MGIPLVQKNNHKIRQTQLKRIIKSKIKLKNKIKKRNKSYKAICWIDINLLKIFLIQQSLNPNKLKKMTKI